MTARDQFKAAIVEQFGKTELEAQLVLDCYEAADVVRFDGVSGGYTLTHGIFWEADIIETAIQQQKERAN